MCRFYCFRFTITFFLIIIQIYIAFPISLLAADLYIPLSTDLGTVVISARHIKSGADDGIADNISVYSFEEIETMPARDLGEFLYYVPGVDVGVSSQFCQARSLSIHGSESRHVLVMVDGIPFNTQLSGQANPARLPIGNIARIEIIKAGASSVWGSGLGGVINVITKDTGTSLSPKGKVTSSFAEFATMKKSLELSGKFAKLGYFLSGSYMETKGIKSISDAQERDGFLKLSYDLGDSSRVIGSFGWCGADVYDGPNPNGKWYYTPYISRYGKLSVDVDKDRFSWNIAYKYNDQDIISDRYNVSSGILESSTVSNNFYQGMSIASSMHLSDSSFIVAGADFDWYVLKSNRYLSDSKCAVMQAPYMNYTLKRKNMDIIAGIRFDYNRQFGSQLSPSLGCVYYFNRNRTTIFRFKVSRAFNAPPLLWIYMDDPSLGVYPNSDLKPERAVVYEIGIASEVNNLLKINLNLYRTDIKDAIGWSTTISAYDNFKKFRRQGAELFIDCQLTDKINLHTSAVFNDVRNAETNEIVRDEAIARQGFVISASYKSDNGLFVGIIGTYNRWSSPASSQPEDRKFIFDVHMRKKFGNVCKGLSVFLDVHNITNSKYWSNICHPLPRRYFEGGFSFEF